MLTKEQDAHVNDFFKEHATSISGDEATAFRNWAEKHPDKISEYRTLLPVFTTFQELYRLGARV